MKPNPKQTLHTAHWTTQQARQVADRYMQGLTSVAEEQALAQFLKTPEGAAAEFDALRAVFAYLDMADWFMRRLRPKFLPLSQKLPTPRAYHTRLRVFYLNRRVHHINHWAHAV